MNQVRQYELRYIRQSYSLHLYHYKSIVLYLPFLGRLSEMVFILHIVCRSHMNHLFQGMIYHSQFHRHHLLLVHSYYHPRIVGGYKI